MTPLRPESNALERCVAPLSAAEFFSTYWRRRPLLQQRQGANPFQELIPAGGLDEFVNERALRYPAIRLVKDGGAVDARRFTMSSVTVGGTVLTGLADPGRIREEFAQGATIVLQALHRHDPRIGEFARDLEAEIAHPVQVNLYWSPPNSKGFGIHTDAHDVFVLQAAGSKHWKVFRQDSGPANEPEDWGPPELEGTLAAGATLYLPKGTPHSARTAAAASVHLTVGIAHLTYRDALATICGGVLKELESAEAAHTALPPRWFHSGALPGDFQDFFSGFLARMSASDQLGVLQRNFAHRRRHPSSPLLTESCLQAVSESTLVARAGNVLYYYGKARGELVFGQKLLRFPAKALSDLESMLAAPVFSAAAIEGPLDMTGKLTLVRRLLREGFLRLAADEEPPGTR